MMLKKKAVAVLVAFVLTGASVPVIPATDCQAKTTYVYYTPKGKKYHSSKNCRTLKRSRTIKKTTLQKAKKMKLTACKVCH